MAHGKYTLILLAFFFVSCCKTNNTLTGRLRIIGNWENTDSDVIHCPRASFDSKNEAVFYSKADTAFRYNYFINNNVLGLVDFFKDTFFVNVEFGNNDNIKFKNLPMVKTEVNMVKEK